MGKVVITLVGVSLLENVLTKRQQLRSLGMPSADDVNDLIHRCKSNRLTPEQASVLDDAFAEDMSGRFKRALTELWESEKLRYTVDGGRRKRLFSPGELASLSLLHLEKEDKIILLYSETGKGAFCAAVLEQLVSEGVAVPAGVEVDKRMIEGLQVEDLSQFTDKGVVNYAQVIDRIIAEGDEETEVILNITGGYKGVAPIATIVALALDVEVCYLYEDSDEILFLPPLEVEFGYHELFHKTRVPPAAWELVLPIETPLPTASAREFWNLVPQELHERVERYIKPRDGKVQLSPLGVLAWTLYTLREKIGSAQPWGRIEAD